MRCKQGGRVGSQCHCSPSMTCFVFPSGYPSGRLPDSRAIIFMKIMWPLPTQPLGLRLYSQSSFCPACLSNSLSSSPRLFNFLFVSLCLSSPLYGTISGTENMIFTIHLPAVLPESPTFPSGKLPGLHVFDMAFHPNFLKHKSS